MKYLAKLYILIFYLFFVSFSYPCLTGIVCEQKANDCIKKMNALKQEATHLHLSELQKKSNKLSYEAYQLACYLKAIAKNFKYNLPLLGEEKYEEISAKHFEILLKFDTKMHEFRTYVASLGVHV